MAIRRNSFVNLAGSLVGLVLFATLTPLYFHVIGNERYGILAIIWAFLTFFSAFDLGMGSALTYRIASESKDDRSRQSDYFWTAMAISVPVGAVTGVILFGLVGGGFGNLFNLSPAVSDELLRSTPALLAIGLSTVLNSTAGGLLRAREYFVTSAVLGAINLALSITMPVLAAVLISPSLESLIIATLIGRLILVIASMTIAQVILLQNARPTISLASARALLGYGSSVSIGGLLELAISSADRLILGAVAGSGAVAYYAVPSSAISRVMVFPASLGQAALPQLAARAVEEEKILGQKMLRMIAVLSPVFVIGIFLTRPFLTLWMGASFALLATLPMQILLAAFWLEMFSGSLYYRILGQGRPAANIYVAGVIIAPYCALLLGLSHLWGVSGACVAYFGRNIMYLSGRAFFTKSGKTLLATIAPEGSVVLASLVVCLFALPEQPPVAVGIILSIISIGIFARRRPVEFDTLIHDLMGRFRLSSFMPHSFRERP